jgi:transmembrane 9 superfamily protein 2/4
MVLNVFLQIAGTATAASFFSIFALLSLWVCVSTPLVFVGSFFGFRADKITVSVKTNQIARYIPELPWYANPPLSFMLGGVLPFGSVCIELFFIMSALWLHQIYYMMGVLVAVLMILAATCAEVSVVMCYLQLCAEDHRWWRKCRNLLVHLQSMVPVQSTRVGRHLACHCPFDLHGNDLYLLFLVL